MDIQSKVIIKLDIRNAFNCISRRACDDGIAVANCTDSTWIRWCLRKKSYVYSQGYAFRCETRLQQGDPLSPLLFALGIKTLLEEITIQHGSENQLWYYDDALIHATNFKRVTLVLRTFTAFEGVNVDIN